MGKKQDRKKAKKLRNLDELVKNKPETAWATGPVADEKMEDDEEEMTEADLAKKAENKFGVLLMTDEELKEHKQKLRAKPTGNKLGVRLTGKRGNRTINQARKKKKLVEKALGFVERREAKDGRQLARQKNKLTLKQLY